MKLSLTNFVPFITIICLIASSHGFQDELCKHPSYARYIDIGDVSTWNCSGSAVLWSGNGLDTIEWSAENNNEEMILEIEFNAAKTITEIHTGKRTTISLVKMMYSQDGNEWDYRFLSDDKKNEEETVIFDSPLLIKYLKLMAVAVYYVRDETYMDFKIVACNQCNNSLVSKLDVNSIYFYTYDQKLQAIRGNIRLSDDWPPFMYRSRTSSLLIRIYLGKVYYITGMIIKGKEGEGTMALNTFSISYANTTDKYTTTLYKNEIGNYQDIRGTTKEENVRYEPFYPPFLASYIFFQMTSIRDPYNTIAIQLDFLGCNTTASSTTTSTTSSTTSTTTSSTISSTIPPCSDIINTIPGEFIYMIGDGDDECWNDIHLEIKFVENGIYKITSVKVTITDNDIDKLIDWDEKSKIFYNYDSDDEGEIENFKKVGFSRIFSEIESPVQSLKLCMYSGRYRYKYFDGYDGSGIYEYITIEVRGCRWPNGYTPTSSSIE